MGIGLEPGMIARDLALLAEGFVPPAGVRSPKSIWRKVR
jgi:hypothetical protein